MNVSADTHELYDVDRCVRCDQPHPGTPLRRLTRPSVVTDRRGTYVMGSWFLCPVTREPAFVTDPSSDREKVTQ